MCLFPNIPFRVQSSRYSRRCLSPLPISVVVLTSRDKSVEAATDTSGVATELRIACIGSFEDILGSYCV